MRNNAQLSLIIFLIYSILTFTSCGETNKEKVIIEVSKPMEWEGVLGTKDYQSTKKENPFLKKLLKNYRKIDHHGGEDYTLLGKVGQYVGWFGIVREIHRDKENEMTRLLIEMKYFDGLTDLHLQVVSIYGAGDFTITMPGEISNIPILSLIRVYGMVVKEKNGIPEVRPEYIRVWNWGLFTFMEYGKDKSNPKWLKLRKLHKKRVYSSIPDQKYYEDRLGKKESDKNLSKESEPLYKSELLDDYFYEQFFRSPFLVEKSLKPVIKSLKNAHYKKAIKQLNKLDLGWKEDTYPYLWRDYWLCLAKAQLGTGNKEKAIESILKTLDLPGIKGEDIFATWCFLRELGYPVHKEKVDWVLGVTIEMIFASDEGGGVLKVSVFESGEVEVERVSHGTYAHRDNDRDFIDLGKNLINIAKKKFNLFSPSKEPCSSLQDSPLLFSLVQSRKVPLGKIKFTLFTPLGERIYETSLKSVRDKNHQMYRLYSALQELIRKFDKKKEVKKKGSGKR